MIKTQVIEGGWYSDISLSGDICSLVRSSHVVLNSKIIPLPTLNDEPLFLSMGKRNGVIYLAGQGSSTGDCLLYSEQTKSWESISTTFGVNPVAFDINGLLHVVVSQNIVMVYDPESMISTKTSFIELGSQGIRYINNDNNTIVSGDSTYGPGPYKIAQYTELTKGLAIGQSYIDGVTLVYDKRYQIQKGNDCAIVRSYWDGSLIANVTVHQGLDERAVFQWFDLSDLWQFPLEPTIEIDKSGDTVVPMIVVNSFSPTLKRGRSTKLIDMKVGDTRISIDFDHSGNMTVQSENSKGKDSTGIKRHVEISS